MDHPFQLVTVGVDLADPGFWSAGLDLIERRLAEAEAIAAES